MNEPSNEINQYESNPILDIVNTIQSKLNETNNTSETNYETNSQLNSTDNLNNLNLKNLDISKILETFNSSKANSQKESTGLNLDLNSLMNFQNILGNNSQKDPRQNLLTSLKPFLRANRQRNLDTYISILGIMKTFNIFTNKDRD